MDKLYVVKQWTQFGSSIIHVLRDRVGSYQIKRVLTEFVFIEFIIQFLKLVDLSAETSSRFNTDAFIKNAYIISAVK